MTAEQLLHAAEQLSDEELKLFAQGIVQLEAKRREPALSERETELLARINRVPSTIKLSRYRELRDKRRAGSLTDQQQQELAHLSDWIEEVHAARMAHAAELARLRSVNLVEMIRELGIQHWAD